MVNVQLAFRSAQKTHEDTKLKIRELLHIPSILYHGSSTMLHLTQELEDTIALYLRKTVEKHDIMKNFEVEQICWLLYSPMIFLSVSDKQYPFVCRDASVIFPCVCSMFKIWHCLSLHNIFLSSFNLLL